MKEEKIPEVEIYLGDFVEWWLDDSLAQQYNLAIESLTVGSEPITKTVLSSKELFGMCGYLPFRFVKNIKSIKKFLTEKETEEEEIYDTNFTIKWIE